MPFKLIGTARQRKNGKPDRRANNSNQQESVFETISEEIKKEMLERIAQRETLSSISNWLRDTHGFQRGVSAPNISKYVNKLAKERAQVTRAIAEEKLAESVSSDIDCLDDMIKKFRRLTDQYYEMLQVELGDRNVHERLIKSSEQLRKVVQTKLAMSGANNEAAAKGPSIFIPEEDKEDLEVSDPVMLTDVSEDIA